ncbi:MAG: succinate-semialdehyde dehydrogenase [Candidatus Binatia bacterium]|nr:MAG: succinate-semialdehyde dehydrogenase [Candidatus Binatia bacterium]
MQAAVLYNFNEPLRVEDVELQEPREGEVRVRMAASGVCHSDLSIQRGILPMPPPVIIGHEGAGVVEAVGPGVHSVKEGDHVILTWLYSCGRCRDCGRGRPHLCEKAAMAIVQGGSYDGTTRFRVKGQDMRHWVGTFATHTIVPEEAVVPIRKDVPLTSACLVGCGVMTGVGAALNTAKIEPGDHVAVFGCGGVGLNVIQGAALCGAERIVAVDLVEKKLRMAQEFGATHTVNAKEKDPVEQVKALTDGKGAEYVFEVIGNASVIQTAFQCVRRGGKLVLVGVPPFTDQISFPAVSFPLEEKAVLGSYYGSPRFRYDMPRILDLYMAGKLKLDELVSRKLPLRDINVAFDIMEKGEVARSVIVYE